MNDFSLLETILYTPREGFYLLDKHIARVLQSADKFHQLDANCFANKPNAQAIKDALHSKVPTADQYLRVRLLINTNCEIQADHTVLDNLQEGYEQLDKAAESVDCLEVVLDTEPVPCSRLDPFLLNKTTRREVYNAARKRTRCGEPGGPFDVILWNKEGHITETSIANIAVRTVTENGELSWKTPNVRCGLLPGVFREHLLEQQQMVEDLITVEDIVAAQEQGNPIICFNSVRRAYKVRLLL